MRLEDVQRAFEVGKRQYEQLLSEAEPSPIASSESLISENHDYSGFRVEERYGQGGCIIAEGDNLVYMIHLLKNQNMAGKLQLIYGDPPFFSKAKYQASLRLESEALGSSSLIKLEAYEDVWNKDMGKYLTMLTARLFAMRDLLSETGCIWIHLDWHVSHYVKLLMDQIFGRENFINEVIWTYKSGGSRHKGFARKHDTLLLYSKSSQYKFHPLKEKSYNRGFKPYRFKGVEEFEDEQGWYTMVNMKDVWSIDMVGRTSGERTGYATQKPEKLMDRIIESCSDEGDLCGDFFAGSGSFGAVCRRMNRRWLMCDMGRLAVSQQIHRLGLQKADFDVVRQSVKQRAGVYVTGNREAAEGRLRFEISDGEIRLLSYDARLPEDGDLPAGSSTCAKELVRYGKEDSLSLIKCWSMDFHYDGRLHRGESIMVNGENRCSFKAENVGTVWSILIYDVLGNRTLIILKQ